MKTRQSIRVLHAGCDDAAGFDLLTVRYVHEWAVGREHREGDIWAATVKVFRPVTEQRYEVVAHKDVMLKPAPGEREERAIRREVRRWCTQVALAGTTNA